MTNIEIKNSIDSDGKNGSKNLQRLKESILKHPKIQELISKDPDYQKLLASKNTTLDAVLLSQNNNLKTLKADILKISLSTKLNQSKALNDLMQSILYYSQQSFANNSFSDIYNNPNSAALILALQYTLKQQWATIDVDGIYGPQTKLAVIEYQKKYNLTVDAGRAGKQVINKLLEVSSRTNNVQILTPFSGPEISNLSKNQSITINQAKRLAISINNGDTLDLNWLTSIDKDIAAELWNVQWYLSLDWLTSIDKDIAAELWKVQWDLSLDWLTSIDKDIAAGLWKVQWYLSLNWLTSIDKDIAAGLWNVQWNLSLNWLTSIDKDIAAGLWKVQWYLSLNWLTSIDKDIAAGLWNVQWNLSLNWLTSIDKDIAAGLW